MQNIFLFLFLVFSGSLRGQSTTWFVSHSILIEGDGKSWTSAFKDLHSALKAAQFGDSIWVAKGVYKPDSIAGERAAFFELRSGISLFGGFSGIETNFSHRDWKINETILSGEIGSLTDTADNSYTIMYSRNADSTTIIDGFTFEHGTANNSNFNYAARGPQKCGGALYLDGEDGWAYADIKNCTFRNNYAHNFGGAVYVNGVGTGSTAPRFINCEFIRNHARLDGAAIYRDGGAWVERTPDFYNCSFVENYAGRRGGAIYFQNSDRTDVIEFIKLHFIKNSDQDSGGALAASLGRVNGGSAKIDSCYFFENMSTGIQDIGFNDFNFKTHNAISITNCRIQRGVLKTQQGAGYKGSIFISDTDFGKIVNIENIVFEDNAKSGSIVISRFDSVKVVDLIATRITSENLFTIHDCKYSYFRLINIDSSLLFPFYIFGGANSSIYIVNSIVHACKLFWGSQSLFSYPEGLDAIVYQNCVFFNNNIVDDGDVHTNLTKAIVINSTIADVNISTLIKNGFQEPSQYINCHFTQSDVTTIPLVSSCTNCIQATDALFVGSEHGNFQLLPCSPLINAGTNNALFLPLTDFNGHPRIQDNIVDIGPFESPQLTGNLQALGPVCHQDSNGKIQFSLPNGCLPAQLSWSKSDGQIGSDSLGLSAGVYAVTLTDGRGKTISDTLQILGSSPAVEVSGDSINCFGSSPAALFSTVSGGVDPLVFLWNTGQNASEIDDLGGGTYLLTVTDALGCTAVDSVKVIETDSLGISLAIVEASWIGGSNGAASVDVFAGLAPFSLLWSTGDTTRTIAGLVPSEYFLTVTDGAGCEEIYPFTISFGTSTDEPRENEIRFSPNPTDDFVQIELLKKGFSVRSELRFSNVLGETVFQTDFSSSQTDIRTADWPSGLYLAQLFENGILKKTSRLIVAH